MMLQLTNHQVHRLEEELQVNDALTWVTGTPGSPRARPEAIPCSPPLLNLHGLFLITMGRLTESL